MQVLWLHVRFKNLRMIFFFKFAKVPLNHTPVHMVARHNRRLVRISDKRGNKNLTKVLLDLLQLEICAIQTNLVDVMEQQRHRGDCNTW